MEQITRITKESLLNREWNKHFERKTLLELQIALQKQLDPEEKSAKKPLRMGSNGQPISWEEITRAEHIDILDKELEDVNLVLKIIEESA
jgi:hypothetical protein